MTVCAPVREPAVAPLSLLLLLLALLLVLLLGHVVTSFRNWKRSEPGRHEEPGESPNGGIATIGTQQLRAADGARRDDAEALETAHLSRDARIGRVGTIRERFGRQGLPFEQYDS